MSAVEIPKKIFRHVLKGLQFFHTVDGIGCTHNEIVSFVFLKNNRTIPPHIVERWVDEVLHTYKRCRILRETAFGNYSLHDVMLNGHFEDEEYFVINPNRNQANSGNNTSQESLSTVPHYHRVLNRKGERYPLPKHKVHGNSKFLQ
uniref:Uncharacterized protein n=1 Tax=Anopheles minimus TaxID=112268 RepID=A0A182WNE5_9DIPT